MCYTNPYQAIADIFFAGLLWTSYSRHITKPKSIKISVKRKGSCLEVLNFSTGSTLVNKNYSAIARRSQIFEHLREPFVGVPQSTCIHLVLKTITSIRILYFSTKTPDRSLSFSRPVVRGDTFPPIAPVLGSEQTGRSCQPLLLLAVNTVLLYMAIYGIHVRITIAIRCGENFRCLTWTSSY